MSGSGELMADKGKDTLGFGSISSVYQCVSIFLTYFDFTIPLEINFRHRPSSIDLLIVLDLISDLDLFIVTDSDRSQH